MSTSMLYHGFGVRHYRYMRTAYFGGSLIFHIEKDPGKRRCADCGSRSVVLKGRVGRKLRTLPIGRKRIFLQANLHRLLCICCGSLKLEPLLISDPKRHRLCHLRLIGIDEVAIRKGHNYLTIVVDMETGKVVWVGEGRKTEALESFMRRLKRAGAQIEAVAMDMWPVYFRAVSTHFGRDVIVFDRYHVIADCNRTLEAIRTSEVSLAQREDKPVFKGVRCLLVKGSERITEDWNVLETAQ